MAAITLSVILITRNEAHNLEGCLESVAFADEWIVVDSGSTDGTREIAERYGAKVVTTSDWPGFGVQKNRALALAQGQWVLSIDADERVSGELAHAIREVIEAETSRHASHDASGMGTVGYEVSRLVDAARRLVSRPRAPTFPPRSGPLHRRSRARALGCRRPGGPPAR
jgi:glycosyltransferase involved in cell wall biosynthesis